MNRVSTRLDGMGKMIFIINVCACRDADLSRLEKIMESNLQQQSRFLREDGFFCGSCSRKHFTETEICLQIKPIAEELDGDLLFLPNQNKTKMTKEDVLKMITEGESQCVELKSSFNVEAMETISSVSRTPITNFRQWKSPI